MFAEFQCSRCVLNATRALQMCRDDADGALTITRGLKVSKLEQTW